jgi:Fur family ferric uptake transcriptional regulator
VGYVSDIEQRVAERLGEGGVRFTQARRLAVRALARSSLYRTLTVLEDAGVLDRSHDAQGIARYEPAEWLLGHHHHLVCVECGAVEDIKIDPAVESEVSALVARIAGDAGYVVTDHKIDIEGICRTCAR